MIQLLNGDCLEVLKTLPDNSIDVILCDPPYGIDYQSNRIKDKSRRKNKILNDKTPFIKFIQELPRLLKKSGCLFIFTKWTVQQQFIDECERCGLKVKNVLIWDKAVHGMGDLKRSFGNRYESIIFCANEDFRFIGKRPVDILRFNKVPASALVHPNEKPTALLEYLISITVNEDGTVLDPTMGSGTTGIATKNIGRSFIGIELDKTYYDLCVKRINDCTEQIN